MTDTSPPPVYATFAGTIDQAAVQRMFQGFTGTMSTGTQEVHLLFHSGGGFVGDGIALYNFFRALPIDLTLYNAGTVGSIATIAYLGARKRKTSAYAAFMIHRSYVSPPFATARRLEGTTKSLLLDDERSEAILREHLKLSDEHWRDLEHHDVNFSARQAVDIGLAD